MTAYEINEFKLESVMENGILYSVFTDRDGNQQWSMDDKLHREYGPAKIWSNGCQEWWYHGERHRLDGPASVFIDSKSGFQEWWYHGKRHRLDGPATIGERGQCWYVNGKLHRVDGPACLWANGKQEWWINGEKLRVRSLSGLKKWLRLQVFQ